MPSENSNLYMYKTQYYVHWTQNFSSIKLNIYFFLYFDYITSVTVTQLEKQNRALYIRWNIYFSRFSSVLTHCQTLNIMFYNICFLFPKMHRGMVCSLNIYVTCTITMRFFFFRLFLFYFAFFICRLQTCKVFTFSLSVLLKCVVFVFHYFNFMPSSSPENALYC